MRKMTVGSLVCVTIAAFLAGCATAPKGPTDEEMVMKRIGDSIAAAKAKDFAAFDTFVSGSFSSDEVGDKAALLDLMHTADSMGLLDDFEVDLSQAKTVVTGDKCTVGPITASASLGSITVTGHGVKEKGVWMIAGGGQEY